MIKRCKECGKLLAKRNESGFCRYHYSKDYGKTQKIVKTNMKNKTNQELEQEIINLRISQNKIIDTIVKIANNLSELTKLVSQSD